MSIYIIFLCELILLFFFSQQLTKTLSHLLLRVFASTRTVIHILSFLFLPGVIIHELSHLLLANILFVPTGEVEFVPEVREGEVKMGSVAIARTDPFRRFLIGAAPLYFGLLVLFLIFWYFSPLPPIFSWQAFLILYCVFEITNTMFSSKKDMEGALGVLIGVLIILIPLIFLGVPFFKIIFSFLSLPGLILICQRISLYLGVALVLDGGILLLAKLLHRR